MKTLSKIFFGAILTTGALFLSVGCSTPETRIKAQPELFAKLTPEDQALIKSGRVAVGFTPEMVKLALGEADRRMIRTDANGTNEVWVYAIYETTDGAYLYRGYYHSHYLRGDPFFPYYMSVNAGSRRERETYRLQFAGGKVSVIEESRSN